jgi:alpha/beta superfamily hydrolase
MADEPSNGAPTAVRTTIRTADGVVLEAERTVPTTVRAAASIAHPHPLYGGTMHDAVVMTLDRVLVANGIATVRFAFRGTAGSDGTHSGGPDERQDVLAALDHAASLAPGLPLLACGYSFGADVTLATTDDRIAAWLAVAPPIRLFEDFAAAVDPRPKHLFVAAHDQYSPPDAVRGLTAGWVHTSTHVVDLADHFFRGALDRLADATRAALHQLDLNLHLT